MTRPLSRVRTGTHSVHPVAISFKTMVCTKLPDEEVPEWATKSTSTYPGGGSFQPPKVRTGTDRPTAELSPARRRCRRCGRKLTVRYTGTKHNIPRYSCWRGRLDNGEPRCIAFGGLRVDDVIEEALLRVVERGAIAAAVEAEAQAASRRDQVRDALMRDREAARYSADRAFRQYDAEPAGRGGTGVAMERGLTRLGEIESRIAAQMRIPT
ncbi:hypothetical protein [Mesorhizobium sp. M5C.F.Cr.IN.023.01.1.1]|uniref:hypothetical protein n=1 Tax=Mesorhizobium sp. M5C.F.Cr.IN.023.01.1.1 TaxID=2496768 RepID=UPI001FE0A6DF|nr:hypothetical protein [Mesorhizobium sp. M5C.F.Cr.IN.023.01.1.1]